MAQRRRASKKVVRAERCSASAVLRDYMEDLVDAIQDAEITSITMKLYSRKVISKDTRDRVRLPALIATEKTSCLLYALESAVKIRPQVLDTFLNILNQYRPFAKIAKKMRDRLHHSVPLEMYCETCHQLFCQHCKDHVHKTHKSGLVAVLFPKHKKELERELAAVKQQLPILTAAEQAMEDRIDQLSVQGKKVEQQIRTATQQAIERLQESEEKTIKMVRSEKQRKCNAVNGQKKEVSRKRRCLMDFQTFVKEKVMAASPQQVLTVKRKKMDQVQSVRSEITPSTLQPVEEASIKFILSQDLLSRCSELGDVNTFHDIAAKTRASGKGIEIAMAQETTSFELTASSFSPLDALSCQLTAPGSSEPVECTITPTQSGGCSISYTPVVRGPHQMRITVGGTDIPNSPFTIHVYPTPEMRGKQISAITELNFLRGVAVSKSGEVVVVNDYLDGKITMFKKGRIRILKGTTAKGIAFTCNNNLVIANTSRHEIQMFTLEGKHVESVGQHGSGKLQFLSPQGIMVHPSSDEVFIADSFNHRIQVLNKDLTYSREFGSKGSKDGQFMMPVDIACDSRGDVYVTDCKNHRVQVFTPSGQFNHSFNMKELQDEPSGITIDPMDTVYVSNGIDGSISMFNTKRQFIKRFGKRESGPALGFVGLAVDNNGDLLVCDQNTGSVVIY